VIVGVVQGIASHHHLTWEIGLSGALGMLIAIGIWWVYFDFVSFHAPKRGLLTETSWLYLHLPLQISIASVGAAILNVINHTGADLPDQAKFLLIGAISISLVSVSLLLHTVEKSDTEIRVHRIAGRITFAAAFIVWSLAFIHISTIPFLIILNVIMLAPVFFGFRIWLKEQVINNL
jgi:low temperature requirement protein LtrA